MVAKRSSRSKSMSKSRRSSSVKRSSVKRSSRKRSSRKRMSMKKKLALGAAGSLAALIAGRQLYKNKAAATGLFYNLRERMRGAPKAPPQPYGPLKSGGTF